MDFSARIVALLVERPHWSNSALARRVGCEQRRVRRYRRRLAECGATPEEICDFDATSIREMVNERAAMPPPDFEGLRAAQPHASARALWRTYVAKLLSDGLSPMSYPHFMRHMSEWAIYSAEGLEARDAQPNVEDLSL